MKWWTLAIVLLCLFWIAKMPTRRRIMRQLWLNTKDERLWFANQFSIHYRTYHKSVTLFALRRLSRTFKMPLTMIDGAMELRAVFEVYKAKQSRLRRMLSRLTPQPDPTNPLQIIMQDFSDAEDDFESARKSSQKDILLLTPLNEHSTVSDYVRFIVEYDTMWQRVDHLRVTTALGS